MTEEARDVEIKAMKDDIGEIKQQVESMPDKVCNKINETMDLKIKIAIAETEKKYQMKFIALLLSIISEGVGLIISFIIK